MTLLRNFRFAPASRQLARTGLLGGASFRVGDRLLVEGIEVWRTCEGGLRLSFPVRADAGGRGRHAVRPVCDRARQALERAVLAELGPEVLP